MTFTVFDTETTGTHASAEIVQFAMQLYDDNYQLINSFSSLIRPEGWIIPEETQKFHTANGSCISQENCEKFGLNIRSVLNLAEKWFEISDKIVAHNAEFDIERVLYTCKKLGLKPLNFANKTCCTAEVTTNILQIPPTPRMIEFGHGNEYKKPKLIEAYRFFFNEDFEDAHDALSDVKACSRIFARLMLKDKESL